MRVFGFRLRRIGTPLPGATLFVANHVSWVDIVALHSQRMMGFVAKREIAGWPLVGWLARARRDHLPPARQHRIAGRRDAGDAGAPARRAFGRRVPGRPHPRRPRGRPVPRAHLPGRGRGRRAGAAGGAALRRARQAQTIVAFRAGRNFLGNFLRLLGEPARVAGGAFPANRSCPATPTGAAASPNSRARASSRRWAASRNREPATGTSRRCQNPGKPSTWPHVGGSGTKPWPIPAFRADYQPPCWLRNPHLQSVLATSPLRRRRGARKGWRRLGAVTTEPRHRRRRRRAPAGLAQHVPGLRPRGLALLLHGWEGSAESSYMRLTAAQLLLRGFEVFRLNFRDHGDTHHLNEGAVPLQPHRRGGARGQRHRATLHACRRPALPMVAAGYSLGGNFALRLALRAPAAGLPLARVAAVCPVLDPARTMLQMEQGYAAVHALLREQVARRRCSASARCSRSSTISTTPR